jgi:hypothetical protein
MLRPPLFFVRVLFGRFSGCSALRFSDIPSVLGVARALAPAPAGAAAAAEVDFRFFLVILCAVCSMPVGWVLGAMPPILLLSMLPVLPPAIECGRQQLRYAWWPK